MVVLGIVIIKVHLFIHLHMDYHTLHLNINGTITIITMSTIINCKGTRITLDKMAYHYFNKQYCYNAIEFDVKSVPAAYV